MPLTGKAGLTSVESNCPVPCALSSHSSESATAKTLRARTLVSRDCPSWAAVQNSSVAKAQPRHSVTPPVGIRELSMVQPAGGVWVKPLVVAGMPVSSTRVCRLGRSASKASGTISSIGLPSSCQAGLMVTPSCLSTVGAMSTGLTSNRVEPAA